MCRTQSGVRIRGARVRMPGAEARAALEAAVERVAMDAAVKPQDGDER